MKIPVLFLVLAIVAGTPVLDAKEIEDPIFVRWMSPTRANDQTILMYWNQVEKDTINAKGLIDLGTMLFRRGFPNDALDMYELVLDKEENSPEAWYRIGLVEHQKGNLRQARKAYKKCLKLMSGHGWCNFYLGLLEESKGNAGKALEYYTTAFQHAPELADPEINPEVLYSKLFVGALVKHTEESRFAHSMPMPYLEPGKVKGTNKRMQHTIEDKKQKTVLDDGPQPLKTEPAKHAEEKAAAKSAQDAKPTPIPAAKKVSPQRRRPRRLRATPVPQEQKKPDTEPDQPAEKPPVKPNEG